MVHARSAMDIAAACRLLAALLLALLLLMGCNRTGDFERPAYFSPLHGAEVDVEYTAAVKKGAIPLTDDERELRELGNGVFLGGTAGEWPAFVRVPLAVKDPAPGVVAVLQAEPYAAYLVKGPFRSSAARYSRLIDDTRSDITRLEGFFPVARRVAFMDVKRQRSLAYLPVGEKEFVAAKRRMRENAMLIAEVHRSLTERAGIYRFTLERLVIAVPSPMAVDAERIRRDLERRLASAQVAVQPVAMLARPD